MCAFNQKVSITSRLSPLSGIHLRAYKMIKDKNNDIAVLLII